MSPSRKARGRDRRVVGFTTTYEIGVNHHWCCEFESHSGWGVQHYVLKFVSDLRQVVGFSTLWKITRKSDYQDTSCYYRILFFNLYMYIWILQIKMEHHAIVEWQALSFKILTGYTINTDCIRFKWNIIQKLNDRLFSLV